MQFCRKVIPYACVYCGLTCFTWPPNLTTPKQCKHCCFTPSDSRVKPVALYTPTPQGNLIILLSQHDWMGHGVEQSVCAGDLTVTLWLVSSVEITMDSNSEGSEGNLSPVKEDVYGSVARRRIWRSMSSEDQYGMWCSFSPRWQFTLTMPEKTENTCSDIMVVFVLCWTVSRFCLA